MGPFNKYKYDYFTNICFVLYLDQYGDKWLSQAESWLRIYLLIYTLIRVPSRDVAENRAEKAAVAMSLVLRTARHWPRDVGEYLNRGIGNIQKKQLSFQWVRSNWDVILYARHRLLI